MGRTKGLLCAPTKVILLYFRLQNSGELLQACVFVGTAEVDVLLAVEFPVIEPFEDVGDERMEPCKRVRLFEMEYLDVDEDEALATAMVVWKMAVVPLRVGVVIYER